MARESSVDQMIKMNWVINKVTFLNLNNWVIKYLSDNDNVYRL